MRRGACVVSLLFLLAACGEEQAPDDPYLADLRQRVERLKPEVEREIGRKLGKVEIVVLPRERIAEGSMRWVRECLARIENGPRGEEIEAQARALAEGSAEWSLASVDPRGRIVFPDPGDTESLTRLLVGMFPASEFSKDPRGLDLILVHELVHVHQHRHLESAGFYSSVRSRADLQARRAVLEGHADYVTHRIFSRLGMAELFDQYRARGDPPPKVQEAFKTEVRIASADIFFPYVQGEKFVAAVVEKLGHEEAIRRIYWSPPTLDAVSRPEEYFNDRPVSRWGPIAEDLRRWLTRERGEARLEVIALPMVREVAGDAAAGFREGWKLGVGLADLDMIVLVAESESAARDLLPAWTRTLEHLHREKVEAGLAEEVRLSRKPDEWLLHNDAPWGYSRRQYVVREGNLIVDIACYDDSEAQESAERLARRALRFLRDAAWRAAWMKGDKRLLQSEDPGLRLAAVSRMQRYVPDEDWEVRWLGRFYEAKDETKAKSERIATLAAAIGDSHPAVIARGLRAVIDLRLWKVPWPLLRGLLTHEDADVRRAAWALMESSIGDDDSEWEAPSAEALVLMRRALDDPDVTVRVEACECLSDFYQEPGLVDVYRVALKDEHELVRQAALIRLSNYASRFPELIPEVVDLIDERPDLVAEILGNLGPDGEPALPRLRELAKGPNRCAEAAWAIWRIDADCEPILAYVRESAADGDPDGITLVAELGSIARPVVPEVAMDLAHQNRWARATAAEALGKIGGPEAKDALIRRLEVERDPKVIEAIREALKSFEAPSSETK